MDSTNKSGITKYVLAVMSVMLMFLLAAMSKPERIFAASTATLSDTSTNNRAVLQETDYSLNFVLDLTYAKATSTGTATCYVSGISAVNSNVATVSVPSEISVDLSSLGSDYSTKNFQVVGIAAGAFKNYAYVGSLILPNTVTYLGNYAFSGCTNLTTVTWTNSIESIGTECFYGCSSFEGTGVTTGELIMPTSLASVGSGAFGNCPKLSKLNASACTQYCNINNDGILYYIESASSYRLVQCPAGYAATTITVGAPVFAIDPEAFICCTKLLKVVLEDDVRSIREKAFYGCTSLTSVTMPKDATLSGDDILGKCSALKEVVVYSSETGNAQSYCTAYNYPAVVHCIVKFYDGTNLLSTQDVVAGTAATAPNVADKTGYTLQWDTDFSNVKTDLTVKTVWRQNFTVIFQDKPNGWMTSYTSFYGDTITPPVWTQPGYTLAWDSEEYLYVTKDLTINAVWLVSMTDTSIDEGTSDGTYEEEGDIFTVGILEYKVTKFASGDKRVCVYDCTNAAASKVVIPDTVTAGGNTYKVVSICARVFKGMKKLQTVKIGANVQRIGRAAFYKCSRLKKIVIYTKKLTASDIKIRCFSGINTSCRVKVPSGYVTKYRIRLRDGGLPKTARVSAIG